VKEISLPGFINFRIPVLVEELDRFYRSVHEKISDSCAYVGREFRPVRYEKR